MQNQNPNQILSENGRLTGLVRPTHYNLILKPNLNTFTFDGEVSIEVQFDSSYVNIPTFGLHSVNQQIESVLINNTNSVPFELDPENQILIIKPNIAIANFAEHHTIKIIYTGLINDELKGFYRSEYVENGQTKWIATTQFESTDARQAFPCFDEPNFKATYDVTLIHDSKYSALSNADVKLVTIIEDLTTTKFNRTPKMSTYLVAFIVGEFGYVEGYSKSNKRVRIYSTNFANQKKTKLDFALSVSIGCLDWFENYFNIEFPISKMDMISIPDFGAGAMENWGLITFRPEYLLIDESDTLSNRIGAVVTIAHEISHQWFGNYVTMEFWNYLWLNESMATYYGWLVCDQLFPHWNVWDVFVEEEYGAALELDSLEASHQVEFDASVVKKPKDIDQIFDGISYSKGSCLVRGLAERLGNDVFQQGMQIYMNTHAWTNTKSSDLWAAFDIAIKEHNDTNPNNHHTISNVANLMHSWTTQTGYPVITHNKSKCTICQNRYLKSGPNSDITQWIVPIDIAAFNCGDVCLTLNSQTQTFQFPSECDYVLNPNRTGFYRVMYDIENISDLPFDLNALTPNILAQVLDDTFAFGFSGYQKLENAINMVDNLNLGSIVDYSVWSTILSNFMVINKLLDKHPAEQKLWHDYLYEKIYPHIKNLSKNVGFIDITNEPVSNEHLRPLIITFLNLMNDADLINFARVQFNSGNHKHILNVVAKNSSDEEFTCLLNLLTNDDDPQLKGMVIDSLHYINSTEKINHILTIVLPSVRDQDVPFLLSCLSRNTYGTTKVWEHAKEQWDNSVTFRSDCSKITYLVRVIAAGFNTSHELDDYINFFAVRPNGTEMVVNQTIERIKNKIDSVNRVLQLIKTFN